VDLVPAIQSLGLPVALSVYLLWQQSKLAAAARAEHEALVAKVEALQAAAVTRERIFAEAFAKSARTLGAVVARNNEVIEGLRRHLDETASTRILKALEPHPEAGGEGPFPFPSEAPHG
jgi:formate-dependent phosphoribosylglycinamide formyltransferase (GAR transformylase)